MIRNLMFIVLNITISSLLSYLFNSSNTCQQVLLQSDRNIFPTFTSVKPEETISTPIGTKWIDPRETHFLEMIKEYHKFNAEMDQSKRPRTLVCKTRNGFGNKIQVAISCLLYGIITHRAMVFDMEFYPKLKHPIDVYQSLQNGTKVQIAMMDNILCENIYEYYKDAHVIGIHGPRLYHYFGSSIYNNIIHNFPAIIPPNYYQLLANYFLILETPMQQTVDSFKSQFFGKYTIGLHVRVQNKAYDANFGRFPDPPLELYLQTALTLAAQQTIVPMEEVVWFLACEQTQVLDAIRNISKTFKGKMVHVGDSTKGRSVDASLATWFLLSECNDIITSDTSSFAVTAAARGGITPIMCNGNAFCVRKVSVEPPQPFPLEVTCNRTKMIPTVDNSAGWFSSYWDIKKKERESLQQKTLLQNSTTTRNL